MEKNHIVTLRTILIVIGALLLAGFVLVKVFGKKENIYVPSTFDIGNRSNLLLGLVVGYIILSIVILWVFFEPKTIHGKGAVVGAGILWGIL